VPFPSSYCVRSELERESESGNETLVGSESRSFDNVEGDTFVNIVAWQKPPPLCEVESYFCLAKDLSWRSWRRFRSLNLDTHLFAQACVTSNVVLNKSAKLRFFFCRNVPINNTAICLNHHRFRGNSRELCVNNKKLMRKQRK
jgi:hypothetical protein